MARALTGDAGAATALGTHPEGATFTQDQMEAARGVLAAHPGGEGVVIVAGRPSYAESGEVAAEAVRALAAALPKATFLPALRRGNVFGALDMGLAPGILPGRVSLDAGRQRFTAAWGSVPAGAGLSTADILASMAGEHDGGDGTAVRALVLLGADPLDDFPDRAVAEKALGAGHFVVAVTGHPSESVDAHADVVLPCAVSHERAGTTTNIEGRVSRLGPKLSAPGFAWPDWMIAAELAAALGSDLGLASDNDLSDELARTAPAYAGLTQQVLHSDVAHDGILVPLTGNEDHRDDVSPIDPVALPGVESVERQGAPPRVGTGASDPASEHVAGSGQPAASALRDRYRRRRAAADPQGRQLQPAAGVGPPALRRRQLGHRLAVAHAARAHAGGPGQSLRPRPPRCAVRRPREGAFRPGRADPGRRVRRGRGPRRRRHRLQRPRRRECAAQRGGHAHRQPPAGDRRATGVGVIAAAALLSTRLGRVPRSQVLTHSADSGNGDPLFYFGLNWQVWLILLIKCVVAFVALLVATALMIWFERKVISDMQSRVGPNRAGPWGLLQTLADGTKLIFKEDLLPDRADSFVFKLAPYLSVIPAVLVFTVVPVGGVITIGSHTFELQVADPPMGILLVLAMSGIAVYGVMLAGWSSGSKYPLLGSVRASAQVISYEAALGMTTVMVVLVTGSLSTRAIVASQSNGFWNWNLIRLGFLPFIFFMIAITAELTRPPFDLTEADTELVGGFHTEYSSIRFGLFYLAEFMNTITMSAIVVTLFFGGPNGYIFHIPGATIYMPIIYFLLKTVAFCFIYVWFRAALPRLRYDQLMDLGWKRLIPLTLGWLLLVAAIVAWGWAGLILVPVVILASFLLIRANKLGKEIGDEDLIIPAIGSRVTRPSRLLPVPDPVSGGKA